MCNVSNNLNAAQLLALSRILSDKVIEGSRASIDEDGEFFNLDFTVRVQGQLEIGECQTVNQVNRIKPMHLLKVCMDKLNSTTVDAIVREALRVDEESDDFKAFKKKTDAAWKKLADSTNQKRFGKIQAKNLTVTKVK